MCHQTQFWRHNQTRPSFHCKFWQSLSYFEIVFSVVFNFFKLYGQFVTFWHFKSLDYDQEKLEIAEDMLKIVTVTGGPWTCCQTRHLFIIIEWNININVLPLAVGLLCVWRSQMPFLHNIHKQTALFHGSNCHHLWAMNLKNFCHGSRRPTNPWT